MRAALRGICCTPEDNAHDQCADDRPVRKSKAVHLLTRTLTALLLLLVPSWLAAADTPPRTVTTVVITPRPDLPDPNFNGSIVLVMNSLGGAPAGLILNRPTRIPVARLFPELDGLSQLNDKVYFGGPVEFSVVSFMFRADSPPEHAIEVVAGVYLSMNRDLLRQLLARDRPMEGLRIFIGYSGWAPGQLETEITRGDWTLAPADVRTIFDRNGERTWPEQEVPASSKRT
jgi:putative transcriptional regulator